MKNSRVDKLTAEKRIYEFPCLAQTLGKNWIAKEYKKPLVSRSLIAGWISLEDNHLGRWLVDLESAITFLKERVPLNVWQVIASKLRLHSDRANFKGTIAELSLCVFLVSHGISFDLERVLDISNPKDIDIRADFGPDKKSVYIEVQWLSPSETSEHGATIASYYGEAYPMDYDEEKYRIKAKVYDKTSKFTQNDITLVALDCTTAPELGGSHRFSVIAEALTEAFTGQDWNGSATGYTDSKIDTAIREYADGVIWFEQEQGKALIPIKRGIYLNPRSPFKDNPAIVEFAEIWRQNE